MRQIASQGALVFWFLIVSDDPETTFAEAADHVIYQVNNYSVWLQAGGLQPLAPHLNDQEALKQSGSIVNTALHTAAGSERGRRSSRPSVSSREREQF